MEVATTCRKWSTNTKPGITLRTFEILQEGIVHQMVYPIRLDYSALKFTADGGVAFWDLSPFSSNLVVEQRGRGADEA
jgi:hypothetical protein